MTKNSECIPEQLKLENQLCFPLYAASREVVKRYRPLLEPIGLTYTQYICMMVLWEENETSIKELGQRLFLDSGTLTPVVKALEAKGLVKRIRSSEDERVVTVHLEKAGRELQDKAAGIPAAISQCVNLEPDEVVELYRLLHKLLGQ